MRSPSSSSMADRNSPAATITTTIPIFRATLSCFFITSSILFLLSWISLLLLTGRLHFTDDSNPEDQYTKHLTCPNTFTPLKCNLLRVFMYDLPSEFHFGLLDHHTPNSIWPDTRTYIPPYPGGLNLQHSIEYWLTLDLLFSDISNQLHNHNPTTTTTPRIAIRVHNSSQADIIFVPFFSSLSYNRYSNIKEINKINPDKVLQDNLVRYLHQQKEWKRFGGVDHLILAHHPNSLANARNQLWPAMFILSDFGRYPPTIANIHKDIIAPYRHMIRSYVNDTSTFESRTTLLYFQGAIYRKDGGFIRQELFYMLRNEKDVHFTFGSIQRDGIVRASEGMHTSKFCLNIAGDTPSSNRLFDAIASHCVPVIISDQIELPYEDVIDYSKFCIFITTADAVKKGYLIDRVRGIGKEEWTRMWNKLKEVERHFEFRYPSSGDDAVQMIWKAVARKVSGVRFKVNRARRFRRSVGREDAGKGHEETTFAVPSNFW